MQCGEVVTTHPTVGFNMETVEYRNIKFQVWDVGGQDSIRPYWRCYYVNTKAIVFVVDSSDKDRIEIAKQELFGLLKEEELKDAAILVFANKQDLADAVSPESLTTELNLSSITNRQWAIFGSSAKEGTGLTEGFDWFTFKSLFFYFFFYRICQTIS